MAQARRRGARTFRARRSISGASVGKVRHAHAVSEMRSYIALCGGNCAVAKSFATNKPPSPSLLHIPLSQSTPRVSLNPNQHKLPITMDMKFMAIGRRLLG